MPFYVGTRGVAHPLAPDWIGQYAAQAVGKRMRVADRDQEARLALDHRRFRAAASSRHHRNPARHGFEGRDSKSLFLGAEREYRRPTVQGGELIRWQGQ